MTTRLFTLTDLERVATLAIRNYVPIAGARTYEDAREEAARAAVADVAANHPPFYSAAQVEELLDDVYALAQRDYREQVCDPKAAIAEVLEEAE